MNVQSLRPSAAILARRLSLDSSTPHESLRAEAYEFVRLHYREDGTPYAAGGHNHLLERTTAFLMQRADISTDTAALIAGHAMCEYISARARVSIDIDRSTAFGIVVIDRNSGCTRLVSAYEITQLFAAQALLTAAPAPH